MKAIMLMFDSLNRNHLPPYGGDELDAPNFRRLAEKTCTFDTSYVCSMPCMPARRDLHTGRPNFLHRSWGPLEPFDDSVPALLKNAGIHTHLATDHQHYFENGGCTYHQPYSTWEFFRGQEGDPWNPQIAPESFPAKRYGRHTLESNPQAQQDAKNRKWCDTGARFPMARTFQAGLDFLENNAGADNWFLQIETFDPHEPFFAPDADRARHEAERMGDDALFDFPAYHPIEEPPEAVRHLRAEYAATVEHCDRQLGRVLDYMDAHNLWDDTLLMVWADHGFLLGEHDWIGKVQCPFYEEIARTPFFLWDPRCGRAGERRRSLVQPSIDLGPTLLRYFGLEPTADMTGKDLAPVLARDEAVRQWALFGVHGGHVNLADGRTVYMRGTDRGSTDELYDYTLMPQYMRRPIPLEQLRAIRELAPPFRFTKGCPTLKIPKPAGLPAKGGVNPEVSTLLYDLETDPGQEAPLDAPEREAELLPVLRSLLEEIDTPPEQYRRLGLE